MSSIDEVVTVERSLEFDPACAHESAYNGGVNAVGIIADLFARHGDSSIVDGILGYYVQNARVFVGGRSQSFASGGGIVKEVFDLTLEPIELYLRKYAYGRHTKISVPSFAAIALGSESEEVSARGTSLPSRYLALY